MKNVFRFVLLLILFGLLTVEELLSEDQHVEVVVEMPGFIIQQGEFHGIVQVIFKGESTEELNLISVMIYNQNGILFEKTISRNLSGIGKEWEEYQTTLEQYRTLVKSGRKEDIPVLEDKLMNLLTIISQGVDIQTVTINSEQLFGGNFVIGHIETMNILIEYEYKGETHTIERTHSIEILPPYPEIPVPDVPPNIDSHWYFGDLHVHTGYSSRYGYDGISNVPYNCDNCVRELENEYGLTIQQLRNNARDCGRTWLAITDHSYCIEALNGCQFNEWNHLLQEINTYGYPKSSVLLMRSEEVSLEEDLCSDLACHMGGQFINTYIQGGEIGQDYTSQQGINLVNQQNGLSVINHPTSRTWDWCSEGNTGETGVEIWNGQWDGYDENARNYWVRRLLRGDRTYAVSGSDTHYEGILDSHPMNGVYLPEFSGAALKSSLKNGHSFVTNGPALVLWVWPASVLSFEYEQFLMGNTVPRQPGEMVRGRIYCDTWNASTGYILLYRGIVGQFSDVQIATYDVSMSGYYFFSDTPSGANVYYRAEFVSKDSNGSYRAYTNPVWVAVPALGNTTRLFNTNSFFVAGEDAKCTDVLGSAKIAHGLSIRNTANNPEGRTDDILTSYEHTNGNLLIVGGPAINPLAVEFDDSFGVSYNYVENVSFTITCEGRSIFLDIRQYPRQDICIVCVKKNGPRTAMLVWGYGWQGTYAGSVFMGNPRNWQVYQNTYLIMLRWIDGNVDGLIQYNEITVEQLASYPPGGSYPPEIIPSPAISNQTITFGNLSALFPSNTFFVAGRDAKCTDVLGSAKIGFGLGQGGTLVNPEGRIDDILAEFEHATGNLIPVGGPAINPLAREFDPYFGITYNLTSTSFDISADGCKTVLYLTYYPRQDICIIHLGKDRERDRIVFLVWGYGWQGTYAGSLFIGDPANWQLYSNAHMLMLRWADLNGDTLVQPREITVEAWA